VKGRRSWWIAGGAVVAIVLLRLTVFRAAPVLVETGRVERGEVEETVTNSQAATVKSRLRSKLGAEAAGRVARIAHREGARVAAGEVLVELDAEIASRRLDLAREELAMARQRLAAARAADALARRELERARALRASSLVSQEQLDEALASADRTTAEVGADSAQVERGAAAVRLAAGDLRHQAVRAPFAGVVTEVITEVGESVVPGQPLIEILDPDQLYVSAELDEVDIGRVVTGLPARVRFDPYPDVKVPGTVVRVAPYVSDVQQQNRTLEVEVTFRRRPGDPDPRPGTSADVEIILNSRRGALRVPTFAILEGTHALVVRRGRAERRAIVPGIRNWDYTEILSGLSEGEQVITNLDRVPVKAGARVRVAKPSKTSPGAD
jgi:HlyD family secretion protein